MNEQEMIELAESMLSLSDEQRIEFLNALPTMPSAEDLATVQKTIDSMSIAENTCDTAEV